MTNGKGETGDCCGVPTMTGPKALAHPWKSRRQDLPVRKDLVPDTRYGLTQLALSMAADGSRIEILETLFDVQAKCGDFPIIHLEGSDLVGHGLHGSATDKPARDPHWRGMRRPVTRATQER